MIETETLHSSHFWRASSQNGERTESAGVFTTRMQQSVEQPAVKKMQPVEPARILFAEDSESMRYCVQAHLERAGYKVTAVQDGQIAWEELQTRDYDLLITDHEMPRMTGRELVTRLLLAGMPLPVIVVSADVPAFTAGNGDLPRLSATLQKPFEIHDLLCAILRSLHVPRSEGWNENPPNSEGLMELEAYLRRLDRAYLGRYPEAHSNEICAPEARFFRTGKKHNPYGGSCA
jgi:CheY-like chemotaxis protein